VAAEGGGTGITTKPVLQSLSEARGTWGEHTASTIWGGSIVKVILGGAPSSKALRGLLVLIGERDDPTTRSRSARNGERSIQRSTRRRHVMPPESIRILPFGTELALRRSAPPVVVDLRTWHPR
jgi:type IV secretion system protein VirD4